MSILCIFAKFHFFNARCTFVVTKVSCLPCAGGIDATLFFVFMKNQKGKKTKYLNLRLSEDEHEKLKSLSKDYPSMSSFILDACWHFNGKLHLNKLEMLCEKYNLVSDLRSDLNHLSGNLNQLIQYTNTCIKMGVYLDNTASEVLRIQKELLDCLIEYKQKNIVLEKQIKQLAKLL